MLARSAAKALALFVLLSGSSAAADAADVSQFFRQHCVDCHGPDLQEADLRLDQLPPLSEDSAETWSRIAELVEAGDMPPEPQPRPEAAAKLNLLASIRHDLARITKPVPAVRRMNRIEYEHTVHDLLGIDVPLAPLLPEDGQSQGFDNVAGGLGISAILMERYLEAADTAFDAAIRRIKPSPPATRRAVLMESKENLASVKGKKGGVIESHGAFVDFTPGWPPARVDEAHPIEPGVYRCRVAVWPHEPGLNRTLSVAVFTGPLFGPGDRYFQGMFDVTGTPGQPRIVEFETRMAEGDALHILPWISPEHVTWRDGKEEERPGVAIQWAETHGPLDQAFPSEAHQNLFGQSDTLSFKEGEGIYMRHRRGVKSHYVDSSNPPADVERILRDFVPRAFRRPVEEELTGQFVQFALSRLEQGATFEQALRAGVSAVLCSPHFLLLNAPDRPEAAGGTADDYTLASRLSYFLWSSMPDEELLELAADGRLRDPKTLHAQIERMIADPRIDRFVDNFTGQWLDLREIEFTTPDKTLYPEYDELLLRSMLAETRGFFRHVLKEDLSVLNFVDSDFAVLNQRLAEHYGIPGLRGHEEFRLVDLPADSVRGGVLAQASMLKVTANGTTTSPVLRGQWVLDKLLGQPAPPPPPGVPAVEPDIRGAETIREQLAKHREDPSCNRCHVRIDPPGFALEEFDVIGGLRASYRSIEKLEPRQSKVEKTNYYEGRPVESDGELSRGRTFDGFVEFRERLLKDPDAIARALAAKLLVYGCGRPVGPGERASVDAVVNAARGDDFGLKSMIHAVVDSELFHRP
ncbi:DUF1592 domain-containing protein [Alienimonas californiensis]|uniref:Planctomycete cytochrome C n=1 Tax=Alienimonas californiensis TaxID=2527989 RepID=A0A517P5H9_9PLAN|nr:DUF1592 domain-containing protein [Alienimonas californiensis]QDT14634.1 Planctomycete cytochrome C [Alienimonas californiensis]